MRVVTAKEMRELDRRSTEECGVPSLTLMENAGARVVEHLTQNGLAGGRPICVLCGKGNNGGDGLVVARLLAGAGEKPRVVLFAAVEAVKGDAAVNLERWRKAGGAVEVVTDERQWDELRGQLRGSLVVDALLGTGLEGPARGLIGKVIEDVNRLRPSATIVAVDIPSGLPSDGAAATGPVVRADHTVTFTAPKYGQVMDAHCGFVGRLVVRSIGTPAELLAGAVGGATIYSEPSEFTGIPLKRRADAHKGDFGHVLVVAGSRGKTGAAALAGLGALRAGAGLVTVATAESCLALVACYAPELMTEPLRETEAATISLASLEYGRFEALLKGKSVMAIGPGLSTQPETQEFVRTVLEQSDVPAIVDADGLNAIAGRGEGLGNSRGALRAVTPHPGEMARLLGCSVEEVEKRRLECAREAAAKWNAVVVLKGHRTVIAGPDGRAFINSNGNPGMASGGMGDVLTGVLAAMTAQFGTADWTRVLALGVYLHGLAGDLRQQEAGEVPMIASDVLRFLPEAYRRVMNGESSLP